jgi:Do/DeqQ family serine protease
MKNSPKTLPAIHYQLASFPLFLLFFLLLCVHSAFAEDTSLRRDAVVQAVEHARSAVVNISTEQVVHSQKGLFPPFAADPFFEQFFNDFVEPRYEQKYTQQSLGSGIVFDKRGYILTNWHVVEKASRIKVILFDEEMYQAKIIGSSPELDLAVLKIEAENDLPTIKNGDSDGLMIGEKVIAIGNPFGLSHTVTTGVVSAVSRSINTGERTYRDFIQTDASINPGNSGGPLLNIEGELIGVATAIYGHGAQGIGFAIPINKAKRIVDELVLYGQISPSWVGIQVQELSRELASYLRFDGEDGVLVRRVEPESPAERGGVKETDIITKINKNNVATIRDYLDILRQYPPREQLVLSIFREGKSITTTINTEQFPLDKAKEIASRLLGVEVAELTPQGSGDNQSTEPQGVVISRVRPNSRTARVGIKAGDIILQINDSTIDSLQDFRIAIANVYQARNVLLLIQRGRYGYYLTIPLDS